jgi:TonB-dependent receptor
MLGERLVTCLVVLAASAFPCVAEVRTFDIPAQDLARALDLYSQRAEIQLVYSASELKGRASHELHGALDVQTALDQLLRGTGATAYRDETGAVVVTIKTHDKQMRLPRSEAMGGPVETVIVTSVRVSLQNAQEIKRNAGAILDAISSSDIGALPDKSVAEALKRVPGVNVGQLASTGDTSHYSAEPGSVTIRGLQYVRSELNGRDIFSADTARFISLATVSPELIAGIDTYKSQSADLIEGGIAGSVNLRTRVPFDSGGEVISATARLNYGTLAGKITPDLSGFYSNRLATSFGEFGFAANIAQSQVKTAADGTQLDRIYRFVNPGLNGGVPVWLPNAGDVRDGVYGRDRIGGIVVAQWQNPSRTVLATVQFGITNYRSVLNEHAIIMKEYKYDRLTAPVPETGPQLPWTCGTTSCPVDNDWIMPVPGSPAGFVADGPYRGLLKYGVLSGEAAWQSTNGASDWTDSSGTLRHYFNDCHAVNDPTVDCQPGSARFRRQTSNSNETRYWDGRDVTQDVSLNLKWSPRADFDVEVDAQWVGTSRSNYDITANLRSFELVGIDLSRNKVRWTDAGLGAGMAIDLKPGGWSNLGNYFPEFVMDHLEDNSGNEFSYRADARYDINTTWLRDLKFGFRWADRVQHDNVSNYNWQPFRAEWESYGAGQDFFADTLASGYFDTFGFGRGFMGGNVFPDTRLPFVSIDTLRDKTKIRAMASVAATGFGAWNPVCERPEDADNTCFRPVEMLDVSETVWSGYLMFEFGGDDARILNGVVGVSGNIGIRAVTTTVHSLGGIAFPSPFKPDSALPPSQVDPYTLLLDDDKAFASGAEVPIKTRHSITHILPSLNIKLELPDDWIVRVAASRAISRPDFGLYRNHIAISASYPSQIYPAGSPPIAVRYTAAGGNPYLKPIYADSVDLSVERYFSALGYFSFDAFFKRFHDYISYGRHTLEFSNNGVVRPVDIQAPVNGRGGLLEGFEVAFTRTLDFLPSPWDRLGVQANFMALNNDGIANANVYGNGGNGEAGSAASRFGGLPLEGMATMSGNLVLIYEVGPLSARIAYDWRNKYMISSGDCCISTDIWERPYGQFDGALGYRIGDHWELGIQGSNLLGQQVVLQQQVSVDPKVLMPRSWFRTDRRLEASIRVKY